MNLKSSPIYLSIAVAGLTGFFVSVGEWQTIQQPIITSLSVVAAGVMVRMARGVPFGSFDGLAIADAEKLGDAVKKSVRALRALLVIVFATLLVFILLQSIANVLTILFGQEEGVTPMGERIASGFLGLLCAFVFSRIYQVILGDLDITDMQIEFLKAKLSSDLARQEREGRVANAVKEYRAPKGYGKPVERSKPEDTDPA